MPGAHIKTLSYTVSACTLPLMDKKELPEEGPSAAEDLKRSYREAEDPVERSHYQIAWLLARGKAAREVAEVTAYSERWVREIARRHRERGTEGLGDRRHRNPGGAERALLTPEHREELGRALRRHRRRTAGCGARARRWPSGSRRKPAAGACGRSGVGSTCVSLGTPRRCPDLPAPRRTPKSRKRSKKAPRAGEGDPPVLPGGGGG